MLESPWPLRARIALSGLIPMIVSMVQTPEQQKENDSSQSLRAFMRTHLTFNVVFKDLPTFGNGNAFRGTRKHLLLPFHPPPPGSFYSILA